MSILRLSNISKSYSERTVLKEFSLDVDRGEIVAITGESGSGKSTLLNIIGLLESPNEGELEICNIKNPKINSAHSKNILRYKLSYLFQNYGLIENESVMTNLLIACRFIKESRKGKKEVMKKALKDVELSVNLDEKVYKLSGGEQQRLALAKLLIKPSEIILADEPTGSLDSKNRDIVLYNLNKLNKLGKTIVIVTHDSVVSSFAHRSIELIRN